MVQAIKERNFYGEAFEVRQADAAPSWLKVLRQNALERFEEMSFPTTSLEDWRYTNVAPIAKANFASFTKDEAEHPSSVFDATRLAEFVDDETKRSCLVFINGSFRADLSLLEALPKEIVVTDLSEAFNGAESQILRERFGRAANYDKNAFTALNTVFAAGGACVRLPKNVCVDVPVQLLFLSDENAANHAVFPRVFIIAEQGSAATIIESYASVDESIYFTNAVVEIFVEENARLVHHKLQRESEKAFHIASTNIELQRASIYDGTTVTLGAHLSRHEVNVRIHGEGTECWIDGLNLITDTQHADTHSRLDHLAPHCTSHQFYKRILDGKSRVVFNGQIFVAQAAQKTDAYQQNRNLLLSNEARVDTKPQLEIFADDVKCSHGATVGQLEEEWMFYLLSRGLPRELARNLLTYGFAEEIVEKIKIPSIRAQLNEAILHRLHATLEV
ncbi:MAG: Fe-S cluster assembly protein SufD [Pyrinomonadaceae bacterium]